ncbi:MAG: prolipoprotein diacylglyceryl transferase [Pseudomonadota bacterium]|nr:prolipoprotein diacylglyceryl transferase [Pseudomonadota bacterium]
MVFIHNLDPVAFELFKIKIYWYSLAYLFGFIFSLFYAKLLIKKKLVKINFVIFEDFLGWAVLAVIFGGRLGYVIFYNLDFYISNPDKILKVWEGGMSFHGGLIGLILSIYFFSKIKKINFFELSNLVASCAPFGIFLGRIANFVNGELIGKPTNSNWGVLFKNNEVLRHPSQIYEACFEGLFIFLLINLAYRMKYQKFINIFTIFLIMYGTFRFILEFFREPDHQLGYIMMNLTMGQLLSIPMIIIGFIFLRYGKNERDSKLSKTK